MNGVAVLSEDAGPWPGDRVVTYVYVDGALARTAAALEPLLRQRWATGAVRPELAAPLRPMVADEVWPLARV